MSRAEDFRASFRRHRGRSGTKPYLSGEHKAFWFGAFLENQGYRLVKGSASSPLGGLPLLFGLSDIRLPSVQSTTAGYNVYVKEYDGRYRHIVGLLPSESQLTLSGARSLNDNRQGVPEFSLIRDGRLEQVGEHQGFTDFVEQGGKSIEQFFEQDWLCVARRPLPKIQRNRRCAYV